MLLYAVAGTFAAPVMANNFKSDVHPALTSTPVAISTRVFISVPVISSAGAFRSHQDVVKGTVRDASGTTLIGVSVLIKGTKTGTQTDAAGQFALNAKPGSVLVFSYLGYVSREVTVGSSATIEVMLAAADKQLNEVVVTALGIKRSEKSLTYSTQQVNGDELTRVKSDNMMNSLNGKIAGLTISPSASGVGGSAKVILRGNRSFSGNNQPLYVIDGIPISNSPNKTEQPNSPYGGSTNVDGGDGISNLNPDDIESMSVLKGASASALYGSQAANGVILITTKRGKAGKMQLNFSSSFSTDQIVSKPEFQNTYGRTTASSIQSWGDKLTTAGKDNLDEFYQTGTNVTNAINLSGGTESSQTYFSYANTHAKGVQPGNSLDRHNFNLRETAKFFDNKLTVDGSINYTAQHIDNSPGLGYYFNPLTGLYLFPRGVDITPYKDQYEFSELAGYTRQNWIANQDLQQNPWWITNRNLNMSQRNRILANGSVKYDFNKYLNIQVRGTLDRISDSYEQDLYSGTQATLSRPNGQFILNNQTMEQKYGDVLLSFNAPVNADFKLDGVLGASITDNKTVGTNIGAGLGLLTPNLFIAQNTLTTGTMSNVTTLAPRHSQLQSLFGNVNLSYQDWAFLTVTGRSDWSSNLAYTPTQSYFYPSVGLSFLLQQMVALPDVISYAKIRGTYAQVGNTVPIYVTNAVNYLDPNNGSVILNPVAPFPALKPEKTNTYEGGLDLRMFDNKLNFAFTYYKSNTTNQFIEIVPVAATGYTKGYINGGEVQNTGFEVTLGYDVLKSDRFQWNTGLNASRNKNKVIDVSSANGIDHATLTASNNTNYESRLVNGGSFGDIYGVVTKKDAQGRILVNTDGTPQIDNEGFRYLGNPNPKFSLGWNNNFKYENFSLSFLIDGKFGGQVLSATQALMDEYGVSKVTGDARDAGSVTINGVDASGKAVTSVNPQSWYTSIGGKSGVSEQYVYSATVVRLREASLGYSFPVKSKVVKSLRFSLTGRNIFYFYKKAPYDPEVTMSTGNGLSGVDIFNQPATRNIGFSLNVTL